MCTACCQNIANVFISFLVKSNCNLVTKNGKLLPKISNQLQLLITLKSEVINYNYNYSNLVIDYSNQLLLSLITIQH
jgi:hypothetical protein